MNKILTILFLLGIFGSLFGQGTTTEDFDKLICREWMLKFYEEEGDKFRPSQVQKDDGMIFYRDHKVKSIEVGLIQNGVWEYNPDKKLLSVVDNVTKEKLDLIVISLTGTACVFEFTDSDGGKMKMHMVSGEN